MATRKRPRAAREWDAPVSVRLEKSLLEAIRGKAIRTGKPVSRVIKELLDMALRMQRFPGVIFVEGPSGRRAHVAGTGLDVWEIIELLREFGSAASLCKAFPRLSPIGIRVAEAYARDYPEEINRFLELNAQTFEQLKRRAPWIEAVSP